MTMAVGAAGIALGRRAAVNPAVVIPAVVIPREVVRVAVVPEAGWGAEAMVRPRFPAVMAAAAMVGGVVMGGADTAVEATSRGRRTWVRVRKHTGP